MKTGTEMSTKTPTLTPEGSERGSGDEFVEVAVDHHIATGICPTMDIPADDASEPLIAEGPSQSENPPKNEPDNDGDAELSTQERSTPQEEHVLEEVDSTPPQPPAEITVYDPEGDLVLILPPDEGDSNNQAERHFRVSSRLLASTSSIWKDRITTTSTSTSEVKDKKQMTISLTDDFNSLAIFLKIIHLRFSTLPTTLPFQDVYNLARFSEKYAVYEMFLPFVRGWIEPLLIKELHLRVEWILIAWEFCLAGVFDRWLTLLSYDSKANEDGTIIYGGREVAKLLPKTCRKGYVSYIRQTRIKFLSSMISFCDEVFGGNSCWGRSLYKEQCNMLKDGYLLRGLNNLLDKWEWPLNAESISMSAREFKDGLLGIKYKPLPLVAGIGAKEDHSKCGLAILKHTVAKYSLEEKQYLLKGEGVFQLPIERFTEKRRDVELAMLRGKLCGKRFEKGNDNEDEDDDED